MRRLLAALLLTVALASPTQAAVAHVQSVAALTTPFAGDGIADLVYPGNTTIGNLVLVGVYLEANSRDISSISAGGASLTLCTQGGTDARLESAAPAELWVYCGVATSATTTVTVTISSAFAGEAKVWAAEFSGQHATFASAIEDIAIATNSGAGDHESGTVTTAAAGSLLVGFIGGTVGAYTLDADFTSFASSGDTRTQSGWDAVDAVTASFNTTTSGSEITVQVVMAIAPVGGGGGGGGTARGALIGVLP